MSPTPGRPGLARRRRPDPEAAALVRRTLHEVAAALPVEPLAEAEAGEDAGPLVGGLSRQREPLDPPFVEPAPGARWRSGRSRLLLAAAAVVVAGLAATGLWAARRGDGGRSAEDDIGVVTRPPVPGAHPVPGWLPDGLDAAAPAHESHEVTAPTVAVLGAGPGPSDRMVVLDIPASSGSDVRTIPEIVGRHLGGGGASDGGPVTASADVVARTRAVVERAGAEVDGRARRRAISGATPVTEVPPEGWEVRRFGVGWLPGVGTSRTSVVTGEGGPGAEARLSAVHGWLPGPDDLATFLPGPADQLVHGQRAWAYPIHQGSQDGTAVVWQESPGVVAVVEAFGMSDEDALRVAEAAAWPDEAAIRPATGDPASAAEYLSTDASSVDALCEARPEGTAPPPAEEAGAATTGYLDTGAGDLTYELVLWQDRTVEEGREVTADCWRLRVQGRPEVRGGGPFPGGASLPVEVLTPVLASDADVVFIAAAAAGTTFTAAGSELHTSPIDAVTADGVGFTFLRVMLADRDEVTFTAHLPDGATVDYGPYPLDGGAGPPIPGA